MLINSFNFSMNQLIILGGSSSVGKTTVSKEIAKKLSGDVAIIEMDHFRWNFIFEPKQGGYANKVSHDAARLSVLAYLKNGFNVIFEGTFSEKDKNNKLFIEKLIKQANKFPTSVFHLKYSLKKCLERNKLKELKIPEQTIKRIHQRHEVTKLPNEIIINVGKKSASDIALEILQYVKKKVIFRNLKLNIIKINN